MIEVIEGDFTVFIALWVVCLLALYIYQERPLFSEWHKQASASKGVAKFLRTGTGMSMMLGYWAFMQMAVATTALFLHVREGELDEPNPANASRDRNWYFAIVIPALFQLMVMYWYNTIRASMSGMYVKSKGNWLVGCISVAIAAALWVATGMYVQAARRTSAKTRMWIAAGLYTLYTLSLLLQLVLSILMRAKINLLYTSGSGATASTQSSIVSRRDEEEQRALTPHHHHNIIRTRTVTDAVQLSANKKPSTLTRAQPY